ncbi:DET1- and DDB1-associated protein 1 isoform X2 [Rhodnius prolixus]
MKGLPSYNEENFSKFQVDNHTKAGYKRPPVYIATKDIPSEQVIVTERTNILLRYLHQQWDKKHLNKKRELSESEEDDETNLNKKVRRDS